MAQGKLKVKTKSPKAGAKKRGRTSSGKKATKRLAAPKKAKAVAGAKLKAAISKTINENIEETLHAKATQDGKPMRMVGKPAASKAKPKAKPKAKKGKGKKK